MEPSQSVDQSAPPSQAQIPATSTPSTSSQQQNAYPEFPDFPSSSGYQEPTVAPEAIPSPSVSDPIMPQSSQNDQELQAISDQQEILEDVPKEEPIIEEDEPKYEYSQETIPVEELKDEVEFKEDQQSTSNLLEDDTGIDNFVKNEEGAEAGYSNGTPLDQVEQNDYENIEKEEPQVSVDPEPVEVEAQQEPADTEEYPIPSVGTIEEPAEEPAEEPVEEPEPMDDSSPVDQSTPVKADDIENFAGVEETFGEEEEVQDEDDDEASSAKSSKDDIKEEEDDDTSTITKDMSEAPSETNDGFTEPSTPATPLMGATSSKKKSYRRPAVVVAKSRKKKSVDDSDDDDFYPQRGRGKKKGGGGKKKADPTDEAGVEGAKSDDEDDEFLMKIDTPAPDPNAMVVEKILNMRMGKVEKKVPETEVAEGSEENGEEKSEEKVKKEPKENGENGESVGNGESSKSKTESETNEIEEEEVEQFLIKWKGRSYVHCEWKTAAELLEIDKRVEAKIKRFKVKKMSSYIEDDEDFNSDFVIVDRVVDLITEDDGQEFVLIKWKSLGYEEVTWEPIEMIPADKVELWRERQVIDPAKIREKQRPEPEEWKKMSTSKVWKNGNSLREYQFEGVDWLLYCYYNA